MNEPSLTRVYVNSSSVSTISRIICKDVLTASTTGQMINNFGRTCTYRRYNYPIFFTTVSVTDDLEQVMPVEATQTCRGHTWLVATSKLGYIS